MRSKKVCWFILLPVATIPAIAEDLMQLYRDALTNDTQFTAANANAKAAREKVPQGLAGLLPMIGATANTTWNDSSFTGVQRKFSSNGYNVSLTQPLFRWQSYIQYEQAELQVVQAEATRGGPV